MSFKGPYEIYIQNKISIRICHHEEFNKESKKKKHFQPISSLILFVSLRSHYRTLLKLHNHVFSYPPSSLWVRNPKVMFVWRGMIF